MINKSPTILRFKQYYLNQSNTYPLLKIRQRLFTHTNIIFIYMITQTTIIVSSPCRCRFLEMVKFQFFKLNSYMQNKELFVCGTFSFSFWNNIWLYIEMWFLRKLKNNFHHFFKWIFFQVKYIFIDNFNL